MNFEEKGKKAEQSNSQENKSEKELSISEIKDLVKEKEGVFDSLDKFSKDEIFKKENLEDSRITVDKTDDRFDEEAYAKAGFWKKFENFTRFGLRKDRYDLVKSKDRGLLDKTKINKDVLSKGFKIEQGNNQEREYLESEVIDIRGDFKDDKSERETVKVFGVDDVDGKIIKIVGSGRTEKGQIEAAGKKRESEISRIETVNGAELVGLKESLRKNAESRKNISNMMGVMSEGEKEKITTKLNEEENLTKEKIKEREEKVAEESNVFKEPLGGRLKETIEMQNDLMKGLYFITTEESKLNNQIQEYENYIKEAQKLNLLGGVGDDIVKILEEKKVVADAQVRDFTERKALVASKLEVLKTNKKEIEATLSRVNNIGKTKTEIEEGGKDKRKSREDTKNTEEGEERKRIEEIWSSMTREERTKILSKINSEMAEMFPKEREGKEETLDKIRVLTDTKEKAKRQKGRKSFNELFPDYDYPGREKEKVEYEEDENEGEDEEKVESDEGEEQLAEKKLTNKEIEEIVAGELKNLGIMIVKDRTMREQIIINVTMAVGAMIQKSKKPVEEKEIKKEIGDWYKKFTKNFKKDKGHKT